MTLVLHDESQRPLQSHTNFNATIINQIFSLSVSETKGVLSLQGKCALNECFHLNTYFS